MTVDTTPTAAPVGTYDEVITALARYVSGFDPASLDEDQTRAVVRCTLDAIGVALAGFDAEPCQIARRIATTGHSELGASVIGLPELTTPEYATFANAVMIRYLDMNDTYHQIGGAHPSDMVPAILAVGEPRGISGRELVAAIHVAYEVFASMADVVPLRDHGWDSGTFLQLGAAAGASYVLGLDFDATANALALVMTANMPMSVTRVGLLSHWKGASTPYATMTGVFAARLAAEGMTGPPQAFTGKWGFFDQTGATPVLPNAVGELKDGTTAAQRAHFKLYPSDFETQISADLFSGMHRDGIRAEDIESIDIKTYYVAWHLIGGGNNDHADKWDPQTRETADHSVAFIIAAALADGTITPDTFRIERVLDPALRPMMNKITVTEDPELTKHWTTAPVYEYDIKMTSGERRHIRIDRPRGHAPLNPLSDDELSTKFRTNAERRVTAGTADRLLEQLWDLAALSDLAPLTKQLRTLD